MAHKSTTSILGLVVYNWIVSQTSNCQTRLEYGKSHEELSQFLSRNGTKSALGTKCIQSMMELQMSLKTKESKLAGYLRQDIKCSMEACTTSPSECQNRFTKHIESKINSQMNLSSSIRNLIDKNDGRIKRNDNGAIRELASENVSSYAPTKSYLIRKGQGCST